MARKRYADEADHHERWLISYADLITLLFAFFVVMYAISSVHEGKYRVLSESLGSAFGAGAGDKSRAPGAAPASRPAAAAPNRREQAIRHERENLAQLAATLQRTLGSLIDGGKVRVTQSSRGVSVEINASVLFDTGEAALHPDSIDALRSVAAVLKDDPHAVRVEGHTDPVPIATALYPSNWELSAVRASAVVRLFIDSGVAPHRLTVVGMGANVPVAGNDTEEWRARNRRVEIAILAALPD